jgi:hypothetical protein
MVTVSSANAADPTDSINPAAARLPFLDTKLLTLVPIIVSPVFVLFDLQPPHLKLPRRSGDDEATERKA